MPAAVPEAPEKDKGVQPRVQPGRGLDAVVLGGAAMDWVQTVAGVEGALAIISEDLAAWGAIELVEI